MNIYGLGVLCILSFDISMTVCHIPTQFVTMAALLCIFLLVSIPFLFHQDTNSNQGILSLCWSFYDDRFIFYDHFREGAPQILPNEKVSRREMTRNFATTRDFDMAVKTLFFIEKG